MAFNDSQTKALKAKLSRKRVKTRCVDGVALPYVEGWHAIQEANRIFGFDNWDRRTLNPQCIFNREAQGQWSCLYQTKVRICVRAGGVDVFRDGIGTGFAREVTAEAAHELALKSAETDATKRALATFGNPFGLALYDREQAQVTRAPKNPQPVKASSFTFTRSDQSKIKFSRAHDFISAAVRELDKHHSVEQIYAFWSANLEGFAAVTKTSDGQALVDEFQERIKLRLRGLAQQLHNSDAGGQLPAPRPAYLLPKEKRIRDAEHLAFVRTQACLVCGRRPVHAHHLRFAQPRGMGLKVSDEFTVPVCSTHHDELHRTGDERAWWARHGIIDPLTMAARIWAASREKHRQGGVIDLEALDPERPSGVEPKSQDAAE